MISLRLKSVKMTKFDRFFVTCLDASLLFMVAVALYMIATSALTLLQGFDGAVAVHLGMGVLMIALCIGMLDFITKSMMNKDAEPASVGE